MLIFLMMDRRKRNKTLDEDDTEGLQNRPWYKTTFSTEIQAGMRRREGSRHQMMTNLHFRMNHHMIMELWNNFTFQPHRYHLQHIEEAHQSMNQMRICAAILHLVPTKTRRVKSALMLVLLVKPAKWIGSHKTMA